MVIDPRKPSSRTRGIRAYVCTLVALAVLACGSNDGASPNPAPSLASISPSSVSREGPAFTLTVTGQGFVPSSSVRWNGSPRPTTFISQTELTSAIAAGDTLVAGSYDITVVNPAPGGGTSKTVPFSIPCVLPMLTAASNQGRARVGAIYFDGWSGPLSNFHFRGLADGTFPGREPLSGWQDGNRCAIEQQLLWAKSFGIEFFAFDWYYNAAQIDPEENLNGAFEIMRALPDRHGMKFALIYVNQDPFIVPTGAEWSSTVSSWVSDMQDPAYVRVDGRPLLIVIDAYRMHHDLGSASAVRTQFDELRSAARAQGLPGVYLVGGLFIPDGASADDGLFPDLSAVAADGYDAVTAYTLYFSSLLTTSGATPFGVLDETVRWTWTQAAVKSPVAVIPLAMVSADHRASSADHEPGRPMYWFERNPDQVASSVSAVTDLVDSNPRIRPEPSPSPPLVLLEGWNEISNGEYLVPTVEEGTAMGDAIGRMLISPPSRLRTALELEADGGLLIGRLADATGRPLAKEPITIAVLSASGAYGDYRLSGHAPPDAGQALVGFRINSSDPSVLWPGFWLAGEGKSQVAIYRVSYTQSGDGIERIPDVDFSQGTTFWRVQGAAALVPSDRGSGVMLAVSASPEQSALLDSVSFPVSGGAPFELIVQARIAPGSEASGYFFVGFEDRPGDFLGNPGESPAALRSQTFPFALQEITVGTSVTDAEGKYMFDLSSVAANVARVFVRYEGDAGLWPTEATAIP